jgi:hypothetical protein
MKHSRATGEAIAPERRIRAGHPRLSAQFRAGVLALIGAGSMSAVPALAADCIPGVVKVHAVTTHPRPHHKAPAHAVRKAAHHRPHAKRVAGKKLVRNAGPALRIQAAALTPLSTPTPRAKPALLVRATACPAMPAAAAMSVIPGTIVRAANELPYANLLPAAAPAVTGRDASATEPNKPGAGQDDLLAALTPGIPKSPGGGMLGWGFPESGGGGGGGGPEVPTAPGVPGGPTPPVVVTPPDGGDQPVVPPTGGDNPTPLVVTPPTEGGVPPGGGTPTAAVPEPATWMMMILGFGLVGTATRRRHPQRVV